MKRSSLAANLLLFCCVLVPCSRLRAQSAPGDAAAMQHDDSGGHHDKPPVPPSHALTVSFAGRSVTLSVADLLALPQVTVQVHNAHRNADEAYSGPLMADVLAKAGLSPAHENEQTILRSTLVATGTDHYFVVYAVAEVEPSFSLGKVIVAVSKADGPNNEGGTIQLINTSDAKPARWVHGLAAIDVTTLKR